MIKKISEIVNDIFFEENRVFQRKAFVRNLTEHYKKEFREFSLDGVFV